MTTKTAQENFDEANANAVSASGKLESAILGKDKKAIEVATAEANKANALLKKTEKALATKNAALAKAKKPVKKIKVITKRTLFLNGERLEFNKVVMVENTPETQRAIELKLLNVI